MRESRMAWLERMLQDKALSDEARAELQDERNELDLEQDERHLEKREAQIEQYKDMVTDIAGGMGEAMAQMFSGGEDAFKEALKQMLLTAVNAIHQYIVLAYIKTITDGILSGGVKLATGLAKIAAIEVAFAAVKGRSIASTAAVSPRPEGGTSRRVSCIAMNLWPIVLPWPIPISGRCWT